MSTNGARRVLAHTPAPDHSRADKGRLVMAKHYLTKSLLVFAFSSVCAHAQVITGTGLDIRTSYGFLQFGGNELIVGSLINDPPKVRLATPQGGILGAVSFNRIRPDGIQEEVVAIIGKESEEDPGSYGGTFEVWVRRKFAMDEDGLRLAGVITVDFSRSGEPEVLWAPSLGKFTRPPYVAPLGTVDKQRTNGLGLTR